MKSASTWPTAASNTRARATRFERVGCEDLCLKTCDYFALSDTRTLSSSSRALSWRTRRGPTGRSCPGEHKHKQSDDQPHPTLRARRLAIEAKRGESSFLKSSTCSAP